MNELMYGRWHIPRFDPETVMLEYNGCRRWPTTKVDVSRDFVAQGCIPDVCRHIRICDVRQKAAS